MSNNTPIIDESAGGLFPIRTVSELTSVNSITLRAWESRYGLIEPVRKQSGHRLYTQANIDLINRVVGLLDRGMRIGQVKTFLDAEDRKQQETPGETRNVDRWQRYLDGMVAAIIRLDEEGLENVYNEALSNHSVQSVTAKLITPLLIELGQRWESDLGTIAEEHFFGFYLRNKLGARFHHRVRNQSGPKLLMACLPGERHEVGLLMFALAANELGYRPIILGADMPLEEIEPAATKAGCSAIILSALMLPSSKVLSKQLPSLMQNCSVPVLLGGTVSVRVFDVLKRMGIDPVGSEINSGIKRLMEVVPIENQQTRNIKD
jgi:DNA-binding transcriptional MerR regulator/methylmalonyl-CoA mutase cobalamin-binding subunit